MAGVISQRLHAGVPVERIERHYVKYRVGESLRVVYRYQLAGETHHVAARTGARDGIPAPEVGAALFPFPHDRKLTALHAPRRPRRCSAAHPRWSPGPPSSRRPPNAATRAAT